MSLRKYLIIGLVMTLGACSTTGFDDEQSSNSATDSQIQELENKVGDRIFFDYDSSTLNSEAQETLKKQAQFMSENLELAFTIEGHCDPRGTREYNLGLGERRANAVVQFLQGLGVPSKMLTVVSYGKERPAVEGSTDWSWAQNRRAVTTIE